MGALHVQLVSGAMNNILINLTDPSWWFTGVFFTLLLKYSPFILTFIKNHVGKSARLYFRGRHLKHKRFMKSRRHNLAAVNHQSAKSHAYFLMFVITCALYLVWYAAGPLFEIQKASFTLFIICVIPMYIVQIIWMREEGKAQELVAEYGKVRVTRT